MISNCYLFIKNVPIHILYTFMKYMLRVFFFGTDNFTLSNLFISHDLAHDFTFFSGRDYGIIYGLDTNTTNVQDPKINCFKYEKKKVTTAEFCRHVICLELA